MPRKKENLKRNSSLDFHNKMVSKLRDRIEAEKVTEPKRLGDTTQRSMPLRGRARVATANLATQQQQDYDRYKQELSEYAESVEYWEDPEKRAKERKEAEEAFLILKSSTEKYGKKVGSIGQARRYTTELKKQQSGLIGFETQQERQFRSKYDVAISSMPVKVGLSTQQYETRVGSWVDENIDALRLYPKESVAILQGNIPLSQQQKERVALFKPEVERFRTYKGANTQFGGRLFSKAPQYASTQLAGVGNINIPYFSGEYEELSPDFTIIKRKATVERFGSRGNPIVSEQVIGSRKLDIKDTRVKLALFNAGSFNYAGNFSQDIAQYQRGKLIKQIPINLAKNTTFKPRIEKNIKLNFSFRNPNKQNNGVVTRRTGKKYKIPEF